MKRVHYISVIALILSSALQFAIASGESQNIPGSWKAGVARELITPEQSMWMAGYAARNRPSEGVLHDLWAKALAIEDSRGYKAVLVTTDIIGYPKNISDRIRNRIGAKYGLTRSQIILNGSHTHSGPVIYSEGPIIYPLDQEQLTIAREYSARLENQIVELVGRAIGSMVPADIWSQNGIVRFQVNRRNNTEASIIGINDLKGPNDYAVPVIKVDNKSGELMAVAFGYACHSTVLSIYQFSGDYPGFAQIELEKSHPGATAMFFQGAGADQNPLPRRTIPLAKQYGRELAAAVERVLNEDMVKLEPHLSTAYSEISLQFAGTPPTKEELIQIIQDSSSASYPAYLKLNAKGLLEKLERGESLMTSYPYPCAVWKIGAQPVMILGGELLIEYTIELKKKFGPDIFVIGYSNDVMSYIPSETVLKEGGYEGTRSPIFTTPWNMNIEAAILEEMAKLAEKTGVQKVN
jgi:hypothetical protein